MPRPPAATLPELPLQRALDTGNAPIRYVDRDLRIGPDVAPSPDALRHAVTHGPIAVSHSTLADGVGADYLIAYLTRDVLNRRLDPDPNLYIPRFDTPPPVRIAQNTSPELIDLTVRALQIINAALPPHWQLRIDPRPGPADPAANDDPPDGQILIQFAPVADWPTAETEGELITGLAHTWFIIPGPNAPSYLPPPSIIRAAILVDHTRNLPAAPHIQHSYILDTLIHEIVHALGRRHAGVEFRAQTIMAIGEDFADLIYPLDREALLAIYNRLQPGSTVASLAQDLGPWSNTSTHLLGEFSTRGEDVSFGVALRNGFPQPWATGPAPLTNLADNTALSGNASWSGRLLGFTPEAAPVAGAADLSIALDTLAGDLQFTNLEHWNTGQAPGDVGTGTIWSDGTLSYDVDVRGNTFLRIAGDQGILTGAFLGTAHQAMAGTLQRDDLSAAFGGTR